MGRGRSDALVFGLLMGLNSASFIADADGEGATGRLGWTDTNTFPYMTGFKHCVMSMSVLLLCLRFVTVYSSIFQASVCVFLCVYLWSRRVIHLGFEDL